MSSKRELRSSGSTAAQTLDATKTYKLNSSGALVVSTGTPAGTDILFTGSKSSLRRLADLERNVSILAAKALTDDGEGTGTSGTVEYSKTAGKWSSARTLSLTGDVTGSASIDGSGNVSISTTVASNTVALGTDTTGNYMVNVSAGTGISVSHTQGEGSTATVSLNATTDNVSEGSTNLYHTTARARGAVSFTAGSGAYNSSTGVFTIPTNTNQLTNGASFITLSSLSASTGLSYNSSTGAFSIDTGTTVDKTTAQTLTNKTFSDSTTYFVDDVTSTKKLQFELSGISANFTRTLTIPDESGTIATRSYVDTAVQGKDNTDEITEGSTNLYFTNARARGAVSFTAGSGAYNSSTGVFTIPTNTNQLTNGAGFITGYTETDTLATVTGRGASTGTAVTFSNATASTTTSTGAVIVTGGVGIGGKINVGGGAAVTGALTATGEITAYYSDKRLKENIKPIENALAKTLSLHGVTYNANDVAASFGYTNKEKQVGLLAQDVKAVLPEVIAPAPFDVKVVDGKEVSKSGEDYITVKYEKIVALLVEAIKELNDKVESLEAQLGGSKSL